MRNTSKARSPSLEQDALRRIATLVIEGVQPRELFAAVAEEVGRVVGAPQVAVGRYESDDTVTVCGTFPTQEPLFRTGARLPVGDANVLALIRAHAEPARVDDYAELEGEIADTIRRNGICSSVGVPIVVAGRMWGAIVASNTKRLSEDAEARLAEFTELLAGAIADAEAREALAQLADEQAALRRVATLVAQGAEPADVFAAVSAEVDRVFGLDPGTFDVAVVGRFEPGPALVVVGLSKSVDVVPLGSRWPADELFAPTHVLRTGRSARIRPDDLVSAGGEVADFLQQYGYLSQVASPIVVDGRVWGAMSLNSRNTLPPDTEERLERFTDLVATAIASAKSHIALAQLADEQAALRRVATLVASRVGPEQLFHAVADEVQGLFASSASAIVRFEDDGTATTLGARGGGPAAGTNNRVDPDFIMGSVRKTRRAARFDTDDPTVANMPAIVRETAVRSAVASPIVVEGELWGAMGVGSVVGSLPPDTERRLADFTELVATAISNAESRGMLAQLADEQAALRRVATLVAEGAAPADVFTAVAREVAQLFDFAGVTLSRYEDDAVVVVADTQNSGFPVGSRWPFDGDSLSVRVHATGQMARIDDYSNIEGSAAARMRELESRSAVGAPIVVEGRLWGILTVGAAAAELLPADTADRISGFVELIGTAIANSQARDGLRLLADEQAALRRVATLVAGNASAEELLNAVAEEVARVLAVPDVTIDRFDQDGSATTVVASWCTQVTWPVGSRWPLDGPSLAATIWKTGGPARIDDYTHLSGSVAAAFRDQPTARTVGVPIVVGNRVWGMIGVGSIGDFTPEAVQKRLARFTELVATAIANSEAHERLAVLADEQAALRRVATLVAEGARPTEVFRAVSDEVGRLFGTELAAVGKLEPDGQRLGFVGATQTQERWQPADLLASAEVLRTGRSARAELASWATAEGETAERLRSLGVVSTVASPIVVDGELWGAMLVASTEEPLPRGTEERLEEFTRLVATAISETESHDALAKLVEQQAALRRVATLVAEGAAPGELFNAVAWEVGQLFDFAAVTLNRYEEEAVVVLADPLDSGFPVGSRWPFDGDSLAVRVHATRRMARIDDYSDIESSAAARMRERASRSAIGVPIFVEGDLWGLLCVGAAATELLPDDTADRIAGFVELVGTAISNGQARDGLRLLADEQAALRRVATLVARDAASAEVFAAVATEVGKLLDTDITVVGRYDDDGAATAIGSWSASPGGVPVGTRSVLGGRNVLTLVAETERPARVDGYDDASGDAAEIARRHGWRSSIAAPIIVEGRLWGVMLVATQRSEPFPAGAEERLAAFTDLVATALANAQAHDEVRRFGEEQAALGRVATLVAGGVAPEQAFRSVVGEASSLLGLERIELVRYDGDTTGTVVAASGEHPFPAGSTWSLDDPSVMATVARTGTAARIDDYSGLGGEIARTARDAGFQSAIGAPITVEGRLWGVIIAISTEPEPIPERSEKRLGQFTELVATAVANAEARNALARIADEQAALRRVATLVASRTGAPQLFAAVADEVHDLFGAEISAIHRFETDGTVTTVGAYDRRYVADSVAITPGFILDSVRTTGRAARFDTDDPTAPDMPTVVQEYGARSAVASPIVVDGELWGAILAGSLAGSLPADLERRLADFTDLIATAIANAESRDALARLADEQAALRRVATLVAEGVEPATVFSAVGEEISRMLGAAMSAVGRFEPDADGTALVIVGTGSGDAIEPGSRWRPDDLPPVARVLSTERSVRMDEIDWSAGGPVAEVARQVGVVSIVASPIFVEGRLWGVMTACDFKRLPAEAEKRLEKFSELIATAIANAETSAELAASRRRIVAAADEARRRIERDLHDGIQQRLIALTFRARALTRKPPDELPGLADELAEGLKDVSDELREVSRGIHPTILTEAGLGPALRALARRTTVPIDVDVRLDERLPPPVEAAAYYIASEALTNVTKHARANVVELIAAHESGFLTLEVRDDGIGGVDAGRGSGILGLTDRVEALGGTISIASPPRGGTTLSVRLPDTT